MARAKKLTDADRKRIVKQYSRKTKPATGTELAGQFGVAVSTIYNALREEGVEVRRRGPRTA